MIRLGLFIVVPALLLAAGCGGRSVDSDQMISDANRTNLHRLANLYAFYQTKNMWRGPANEQEFRQFIEKMDAEVLQRMGVDAGQLGALFVSQRDNQPFTIKYGVQGSMRGIKAPIIFEQTGVDGMRMVAFTAAPPREVDANEYDKLLNQQAGVETASRSGPDGR